jgi:hypothetical protein
MTAFARRLVGAALAAGLCAGAAALAGSLGAAGATEQTARSPTAADRCVSETRRFKAEDKRAYFLLALENGCAERIVCAIRVRIRAARGNTRGHGSVALAPRATAVYRLRVKAAGGMAQVERECRSAAD